MDCVVAIDSKPKPWSYDKPLKKPLKGAKLYLAKQKAKSGCLVTFSDGESDPGSSDISTIVATQLTKIGKLFETFNNRTKKENI